MNQESMKGFLVCRIAISQDGSSHTACDHGRRRITWIFAVVEGWFILHQEELTV